MSLPPMPTVTTRVSAVSASNCGGLVPIDVDLRRREVIGRRAAAADVGKVAVSSPGARGAGSCVERRQPSGDRLWFGISGRRCTSRRADVAAGRGGGDPASSAKAASARTASAVARERIWCTPCGRRCAGATCAQRRSRPAPPAPSTAKSGALCHPARARADSSCAPATRPAAPAEGRASRRPRRPPGRTASRRSAARSSASAARGRDAAGRTVARHRWKECRRSRSARRAGLLAGDPVRVAGAVECSWLAPRFGDGPHRGGGAEDPTADERVLEHEVPLPRRAGRPVQDLVGHGDLADVVQLCGTCDLVELLGAQLESPPTATASAATAAGGVRSGSRSRSPAAGRRGFAAGSTHACRSSRRTCAGRRVHACVASSASSGIVTAPGGADEKPSPCSSSAPGIRASARRRRHAAVEQDAELVAAER